MTFRDSAISCSDNADDSLRVNVNAAIGPKPPLIGTVIPDLMPNVIASSKNLRCSRVPTDFEAPPLQLNESYSRRARRTTGSSCRYREAKYRLVQDFGYEEIRGRPLCVTPQIAHPPHPTPSVTPLAPPL